MALMLHFRGRNLGKVKVYCVQKKMVPNFLGLPVYTCQQCKVNYLRNQNTPFRVLIVIMCYFLSYRPIVLLPSTSCLQTVSRTSRSFSALIFRLAVSQTTHAAYCQTQIRMSLLLAKVCFQVQEMSD